MTSLKTGNDQGYILQERDKRLLAELGTLRVVDRQQAKLITSCRSTTRINHLLLRLYRAGLLIRRFVGSVGAGRKAVYGLSRKAAGLVGVPFRGLGREHDGGLASDLFLSHQLSVNQILLLVKYSLVPYTGARLNRWMDFEGKRISSAMALIPDGYFELQSDNIIRPMFLEVDLGTESLKIWKDKAEHYLTLARSGEFTRQFGHDQFRVLVVANSEERMQAIRRTVAALTPKIFWFSTLPLIHRDGLSSAVWLRPTTEQRLSLL